MASRKKSPRRISVGDLATETKLGSHLLVFNDSEVRQLLRTAVEREENQTAFARRHGVERTRLNEILNGKRRMRRFPPPWPVELRARPTRIGHEQRSPFVSKAPSSRS